MIGCTGGSAIPRIMARPDNQFTAPVAGGENAASEAASVDVTAPTANARWRNQIGRRQVAIGRSDGGRAWSRGRR